MHNFDIVEAGIGNGGLAAQIANQFELNSYQLVDLIEVLDLTQQTLKPSIELTNFEFTKPSEVTLSATDLYISDYAFSGLHKEVQDFYFENYIIHAKSGFMLYHHTHENPEISYSAQDIGDGIPG